MLIQLVTSVFRQQFGHAPRLFRAPGRVNLIGEHTDYNQGFVLPAAIDREIVFAVALNQKGTIRLYSCDMQQACELSTNAVHPTAHGWANYLLGVVAEFGQRGIAVPGFDCAFGGNVPIGAGLSSSAAVECGLAFALNTLLGAGLSRLELAHIAQKAEHTYAGVQCGIMDQFASLFGEPGQVVRLDCRSMEYAYFPFDAEAYYLVLCNSGVKHSLASSAYNTRRQECEQGVAVLRRHYPTVQSLRDATLEQLEAHRAELGDTVYRRCAYVVRENTRVQSACKHLADGDMPAFGRQMYASHAGLRDNYEVSCPELDQLVHLAQTAPGILGARMMGGGFGGCTINLVEAAQADRFVQHMVAGYQPYSPVPLQTYQTVIVGGVEALQAVAI